MKVQIPFFTAKLNAGALHLAWSPLYPDIPAMGGSKDMAVFNLSRAIRTHIHSKLLGVPFFGDTVESHIVETVEISVGNSD